MGLIVPLACFFGRTMKTKGKREAVIEIAKHLDDPAKIEELLTIFDERKSAPIDHRRAVSSPCLLASVFTSLGKPH